MSNENTVKQDPTHVFRTFLKNKGLRNTPQRQRIMEVFFTENGHLTTEEVYDRVRREDPSLGQATVYRTMKLLCKPDWPARSVSGTGWPATSTPGTPTTIISSVKAADGTSRSSIPKSKPFRTRWPASTASGPRFTVSTCTASVPIARNAEPSTQTTQAGGVPPAFFVPPFSAGAFPCAHAISP